MCLAGGTEQYGQHEQADPGPQILWVHSGSPSWAGGVSRGLASKTARLRPTRRLRDEFSETAPLPGAYHPPMTTHCDVLIVGAGPTGLVLALWLTRLGVTPRIIDKAAEAGTTSRALAVQARTLELYRQLDLTEAVLAAGHRVPAINLWVKGSPKARLAFANVGEGLTPYPFLHIFPQDQHERLLVERLAAVGVTVERRTELLDYAERDDHVVARLRGPEGQETSCEATYLAGCDGARSMVRETMGTGFPGGTYRQIFYVADVDLQGAVANGDRKSVV